MTISSPIGTVHEYTFTAADVLLNGVSLGIGALTSWTLPRHDGDIRVAVAGGAGGSYTGQSSSAGHGGTVRGYLPAMNGAAVALAVGGQGGHQAAGGIGGTSTFGPGEASGDPHRSGGIEGRRRLDARRREGARSGPGRGPQEARREPAVVRRCGRQVRARRRQDARRDRNGEGLMARLDRANKAGMTAYLNTLNP